MARPFYAGFQVRPALLAVASSFLDEMHASVFVAPRTFDGEVHFLQRVRRADSAAQAGWGPGPEPGGL